MKQLRIASVPYENTRPLIWGIENSLQYLEPSRMADALRRGELDGGMVPIAEVLQHDGYEIVDGCAIASDGEVKSVFLAHKPPIEDVSTIEVDSSSRTSVLLLKVLLKHLYGISPKFVPLGDMAEVRSQMPCLLIGDRALRFLLSQQDLPQEQRLKIMDLGAEWKRLTGLPFVFAVWAFRKGTLDAATAEFLRNVRTEGGKHIDDIVAKKPVEQRAFWREYHTANIRCGLGTREKEAIETFRRELSGIGEPVGNHPLRFV